MQSSVEEKVLVCESRQSCRNPLHKNITAEIHGSTASTNSNLMTWLEYTNLLWNAMQEVSIPEDGPIPHIPAWLRQLTFEQNQAADDAAFHFAQHWKWPAILDPEVRYQLYFRCLYATEAIYEMTQQGIPEVPGYDLQLSRKVLETLLVQSWEQEGFAWADDRFP